MALANRDGSFTGTIYVDKEGSGAPVCPRLTASSRGRAGYWADRTLARAAESFAQLDTPERVEAFFEVRVVAALGAIRWQFALQMYKVFFGCK